MENARRRRWWKRIHATTHIVWIAALQCIYADINVELGLSMVVNDIQYRIAIHNNTTTLQLDVKLR